MSGLSEFKHLQIPFKEIKLATTNFDKSKFIGHGGYGKVYKGELCISGTPTIVAVKRLNDKLGQGLKEFLTEIQLLAGQNHNNVISLLGYCNEEKEMILVYEYAANGSLDTHLKNGKTMVNGSLETHLEKNKKSLTWRKRLEICLDAARGLNHLHTHSRKNQTIIHRDIKSANILLDDNWVAKIADLGLSKLCSESLDGNAILDQAGRNTNPDLGNAIVSNPCGTKGYLDPEYMQGYLKKEYDVYSFGMVLFEVLCGRLCYEDDFQLVGQTAKYYHKRNKMDEIIDPCLKDQMISSHSINKFSELAYKCLSKDEGQRPSMHRVVKELEELLFFLDIEMTSSKEVGNLGYATDPESLLRYEKVKRIFQRFDINRDGVLQRQELANFFAVTNTNYSQEQIQNNIDSLFLSYGEFANGEKVLTCDGMLRAYNYGVDYLNVHFEMLRLDFKSFDNNAVEFRTTERFEKVKRILQRYDINKDGCLNREELANFLVFHNPNSGHQIVNNINNIFHTYEEFVDGGKGLTCDGLFWAYGYGIDNLDVDFEKLHLDLKPFDEKKTALRYEKVKRIFQRFDVNGDGGLNTEEFADFIVFTNPQYINYNEDKLSSLVDEVFTLLRKFINGEKGLTCEGLVHNYDYGIDSLDADFENLRLDLKSLNDEEVALRTRERAEKVRRMIQRFDINKDGGLNKDELLDFFLVKNGHKSVEERRRDVDKLLRLYGESIDGEKGLTCDGLLRTYDRGIDDLDVDFKRLQLNLKTFDKNEADLLKERCEKVRKIFQRFDLNGDGGLNKEELGLYLLTVDPHIKQTQDTLNNIVNNMFILLREFVDDVTGLTYDGMIKNYEYGIDNLDIHLNQLNLH